MAAAVAGVAALLSGACGGHRALVVTPYLVAAAGPEATYANVPEEFRTPDFPVLYVTDRGSSKGPERDVRFSYHRAKVIRYGEARVCTSPELTWEELVDESTRLNRRQQYRLRIEEITPLGSMRGMGGWVDVVDGRQAIPEDAQPRIRAETEQFHAAVRRWLDATSRKEAFVFVHGFNNTFEHAVYRIAEFWHFSGRQGVPIAYSWPAARGGLFGYAYDRESGEFTVVHLKQVLRALAEMPDLEKIHIISHSRGTDVVVTALRELYIETLAARAPVQETLKLGVLVLAAPDIDYEVFGQRFAAEMLANAPERTVIYFSPDDDALWWARWLFDSVRRVGDLMITDLTPDDRAYLARLPRLEMVDCTVSGFSTRHNYVFSHPSALSDLICVVRDGCPPGCPERPLTPPAEGVWQITNDYMHPSAQAPSPLHGAAH